MGVSTSIQWPQCAAVSLSKPTKKETNKLSVMLRHKQTNKQTTDLAEAERTAVGSVPVVESGHLVVFYGQTHERLAAQPITRVDHSAPRQRHAG